MRVGVESLDSIAGHAGAEGRDRELRGGITDHLREQYPGTLRRVKLVQAPFG